MLINLTNHPSEKWSREQTKIAMEKYGEIMDIQFPQIDPAASIEDVQKLAKQYVEIIKQKLKYSNIKTFNFNSNVVHIMGEMTFTHNIVRILEQDSIKCIASTTMRKTIEEKNGKKISVFEFIQFRNYL